MLSSLSICRDMTWQEKEKGTLKLDNHVILQWENTIGGSDRTELDVTHAICLSFVFLSSHPLQGSVKYPKRSSRQKHSPNALNSNATLRKCEGEITRRERETTNKRQKIYSCWNGRVRVLAILGGHVWPSGDGGLLFKGDISFFVRRLRQMGCSADGWARQTSVRERERESSATALPANKAVRIVGNARIMDGQCRPRMSRTWSMNQRRGKEKKRTAIRQTDMSAGRQHHHHHLSEPHCQIGKVSFECQGQDLNRVCKASKTKPTIQVTGVAHQSRGNLRYFTNRPSPSLHGKIIKGKRNKKHMGKDTAHFSRFFIFLFTRPWPYHERCTKTTSFPSIHFPFNLQSFFFLFQFKTGRRI